MLFSSTTRLQTVAASVNRVARAILAPQRCFPTSSNHPSIGSNSNKSIDLDDHLTASEKALIESVIAAKSDVITVSRSSVVGGGWIVDIKQPPPKKTNSMSSDRVRNLGDIIDGYFKQGGQHLNVNVLNREMLTDAMNNPSAYPGLTIRVSGYAVRFDRLSREQQQEVILRTFHDTM